MKTNDSEFDIHVWKKADNSSADLFTCSIGRRALCVDVTEEDALEAIREALTISPSP